MKKPIIYGTMCVKNEGDILLETIPKILEWCSVLFVVDNDSTDKTRDILESFDSRVVNLGSLKLPFQEGFKSIGFNYCTASKMFSEPDWWAIVDADELYIDDPLAFLNEIPMSYGRVSTNAVEFLELISESSLIDEKNYKYYIPLDWSETRFFRNTGKLHWSDFNDNGPKGARSSWQSRIRLHHFPFRSLAQIETRLIDRAKSRKATNIPWPNSEFKSAEGLMSKYKMKQRRSVEQGVEFGSFAVNHYSSLRQFISLYTQIFLYKFGLR